MAKTLNDFTPSAEAALNDDCVVYLVDPALGTAGDLTVTLGTLRSFLGLVPDEPDPEPAPPGTVETPTFSPATGTYTGSQAVTISSATSGATIYYTTNGTTPTTASTPYTGPITIGSTTTVKAIATKSGMTASAVGSAVYTISSGGSSGGTNPTGFLNLYGADVAEYPRTYISSRMPVRTGSLITVADGANLQTALNNAQPGDWIVLEADGDWNGNYTLPVKSGDTVSGGNNVIVVTTSAFASLPEKVRVTDATADNLFARINNLNTGNVENLVTAQGTCGWRLVGLDFTVDPTVSTLSRMVSIGDGGITQSTAIAPKNIILDRCRLDGHATLELRRAVALEGEHCAIINCWFGDEIHHSGQDCQAIASWNSAGPHKIVNNRLQGSTEVIMYGGATNTYACASDIEIRYNTLSHPYSWRGVAPWSVKNIFEIKKARRVLFQYNRLDDIWPSGQAGFAFLIKHEPYGDEGRGQTEDIIIRDNRIDNAAGGINIATVSDNNGGSTLYKARRIVNYNNLYTTISTAANESSTGYIYHLTSTDCLHARNTFYGDGVANVDVQLATGSSNNKFMDNIFGGSAYGFKGDSVQDGNATMTAYNPGGTLSKCIFPDGSNARTSSQYPSDCMFPGAISNIGFTNVGADDFTLSPASLYKNQGTGGVDPGCDCEAIDEGVDLAISGNTTSVQT